MFSGVLGWFCMCFVYAVVLSGGGLLDSRCLLGYFGFWFCGFGLLGCTGVICFAPMR